MKRRKEEFSWDMGLDFEEWSERLRKDLKRYRGLALQNKKRYIGRFVYTAILLTQLLNASRLAEAVEAIDSFLVSGRREYKIYAKKKGVKRYMYIPVDIKRDDILFINMIWEWHNRDLKRINISVKVYANRTLKINTHSLRYAGITYYNMFLGTAGTRRVTGHAKEDTVANYIQYRTARDILRAVAMNEIEVRFKRRKT